MINYIKADIKYNLVFECNKCKNKSIGDTQYSSFSGHSVHINDHIKSLDKQSARYMPIGWSNSYDTGIYCNDCTSKYRMRT